MNERIRELAEQAEKYADENFKGEPTYSEAYDSKFAELIVRECIRVGGPEDSYKDDWFNAKADSVAKIKKHFGVEE